ncbi:hypothetical protein SmJEL517_g03584 [Synchytrium microbalum]|uniref:Transmembrane protein 135 N-terminal domain-containing protein n=1 Tax=Synchytrium microbalum TaxID=1806994 RepID=A0A507C3H5_9FUNG|nr:uncharacterized protein SmJEL517_g03584 [Synchytrium microbalum]TPX33609.1 hypothetical protein SmJEL517_g03584 [Synchytrium microbalum]
MAPSNSINRGPKAEETSLDTTLPANGMPILKKPNAILLHACRVGLRSLVLGYGLRAGVDLALKLLSVIRKRMKLVDALRASLFGEDAFRFALVVGGFGFIWKLVDNTLRLVRGVDDKLNGFIAGSLAGLSLLAEKQDRRIMWGQQLAVRAGETIFNSLRLSKTFHFPFASSLIFMLSSASIMYAYVMQPHTIPKSYYSFIVSTGPIPEDVLGMVRQNVRGVAIDPLAFVNAATKYHGTSHAVEYAKSMTSLPPAIPCELFHPSRDSHVLHWGWVFQKVLKKILPVYLALNVVPLAVLRMRDFFKRPMELSQRSLTNAFRSSVFLATFVSGYQAIVCIQRELIARNWLKSDSKYIYWWAGLLAASSVQIEHTGQRNNLAMYVLPRAMESLYTVLYQKKWMVQIKYFEVAMFSAAMGIILAYFQTEPDALGGIVNRILQRANVWVEDKKRGRLIAPIRDAHGRLEFSPIVKTPIDEST